MNWRNFIACIIAAALIVSCAPKAAVETVDCTKQGSSTIFIADFEDDTVGSLPLPPTSLHYGPPGADLAIQDGLSTVQVINSPAFGSQALSFSRFSEIDAIVGDVGTGPYDNGEFFLEFMTMGETIPEHLIAGLSISAQSDTGFPALELKLYDVAYYLSDGTVFQELTDSYDPGIPHFLHIELDLTTRDYSICIDGNEVASHKPLLTEDFGILVGLKFLAPPTITEAFEMVNVMDDIRITK